MKLKHLKILALVMILVSCNPTNFEANIIDEELENLPGQTSAATPGENTPVPDYVYLSCPARLEQTPAEVYFGDWSIVLEMASGNLRGQILARRFPSFEKEFLFSTGAENAAVSPDGKMLALFEESSDSQGIIKIFSSQGELVNSIFAPSNWRSLIRWKDTTHLLISIISEPLDKVGVLDTNTSEVEVLANSFPDIYPFLNPPRWIDFSNTVYSSDLNYVVYAAYPNRNPSRLGSEVIMWDVNENREVVFWKGATAYGQTPRWSPNDQFIVFNNTLTFDGPSIGKRGTDHELFAADLSGNITRLTYLLDYFSEAQIGEFSWSPNGEFIAFWVTLSPSSYPEPFSDPDEYQVQRLAVTNVSTQETQLLCIPGDMVSSLASAPIWSPDSKFIATSNKISSSVRNIYVVDYENNTYFSFEIMAYPIGWVAND